MNASALLTGIKDYSPELLANRVLPRLPLILTWVLAIAIGVQTAAIVRDLIPQRQAPQIAAPPPPSAVSSQVPVDLSGIQNAHLFGVASAERSQGDPANAPQTQLSLVLAGTLADEDPEKGLGIIGESAATAKVYAVGAPVPGGARLHAVYTDRVILDRNGQLEALLLPRQFNTGAPIANRSAPSPGVALANRVRQMVSQDPGSIAEVMRPQAVFVNGQQRGYRVYPGRNRQAFAQLGLQPGDLVLSLNGTPLDDPQRGMEIFNTIGSADQVRVAVERRGQQQELVLNMAQLANQAAGLPTNNSAQAPATDASPPTEQVPQMPPDPEQE